MYQPELAPLGSLWLSTLVAMLPLATVFVGLGVLKWRAPIAGLTIAATAVGLLGRESEILRRVLPWSIGLLIGLCLLVGLQSTPILSWMLP